MNRNALRIVIDSSLHGVRFPNAERFRHMVLDALRHGAALCFLVLLPGLRGQENQALIVDVVDPDRPENTGRIRGDRPPVFIDGLQASDLDFVRSWLRVHADPRRFPDRLVQTSAAPDGLASARTVKIVCDPTQIFGWVKAVLESTAPVPDETPDAASQSPCVHALEIGLRGTERALKLSQPLPREKGASTAGPSTRLRLEVPEAGRKEPVTARPVTFSGAAGPLGASRGIALHSHRADHLSLLLDGADTLMGIRRYLREVRVSAQDGVIELTAHPETPFIYVFEVLSLCSDEGFRTVRFGGSAPSSKHLMAMAVPSSSAFRELEEHLGQSEASAGGTESTSAVGRGLAWLKEHQDQDGRWNADQFHHRCNRTPRCEGFGNAHHDVGVTGLAILAFLKAGHTPQSGGHGGAVRRALKWLRNEQDAEGCFGPRGNLQFVYEHAIATLAVVEAYGATGSELFRESAERGVSFVLKSQNPYGAWRYGMRTGDNDTSVTTWMVLALESARRAGLAVPPHSLTWAHDFIARVTDEETGRTGYTKRGEPPVRSQGKLDMFPPRNSEAMTAGGMLVRMAAGEILESSKMLGAGAELLRALPPSTSAGFEDHIYWYLGTLAAQRVGGTTWSLWRPRLEPLMACQENEGCAVGSWNPKGPWCGEGGRVFSTAIMTLIAQHHAMHPDLPAATRGPDKK